MYTNQHRALHLHACACVCMCVHVCVCVCVYVYVRAYVSVHRMQTFISKELNTAHSTVSPYHSTNVHQ